MLMKYQESEETLTSAGALVGWTRPPCHGDKSRRSPGPEEEEQSCSDTGAYI